MEVKTCATKPIAGQKPGTSGLRKKTSVFEQEPYTHNFVQSIFNALHDMHDGFEGCTLYIGGDGRYFNKQVIQIAIKMAAANGVRRMCVALDGVISTPAMSNMIIKKKAYGAILLTASHNPGGKHEDFGIKYNCSNGGPAPEKVTDLIYKKSTEIQSYKIAANMPDVDISKVATTDYFGGSFTVEVFNAVDDYVQLMKDFHDFDLIKAFMSRSDVSFKFDCLNGVTGPYATRIFIDELGGRKESVAHCVPLEDFGGLHPDPNLVHCAHLVKEVNEKHITFASAWDGDGDRHLVCGNNFFASPSDGIAVLCAHAKTCFKYFATRPVKGVARSMPTSCALDRVSADLGLPMYETPTGWKFFGNLLDDDRISICGEESFGSGCEIIREKDGIWATLAWLSILAHLNPQGKPLQGLGDIVKQHWLKYGRDVYARYDFENVSSESADNMMERLRKLRGDCSAYSAQGLESVSEFSYLDPVDHSVTEKQGMILKFATGERVVIRLSGTGSAGATIRVYVEKHFKVTPNDSILNRDSHDILAGTFNTAMVVTDIPHLTGKNKPDVMT